MGLDLDYIDGQTPLDEDEKEGLLIPTIATRGELDEFEQQNIEQAVQWSIKKSIKLEEVFTEQFIRDLHKKMYGGVWDWAGKFRKTDKNIGVDKSQISVEVKKLIDDTLYWVENKTYEPDEIAIRFKHRLVSIHCFPNGNGRHSRLMADIIIEKIYGLKVFSWGANDLVHAGDTRKRYINAIRSADKGNYKPLIDFEDESGPVSFTPAPQQMAQATQTQPQTQTDVAPGASEQGAQPWLERERVGPPYEANGRWYFPTPEPGYQQTGTASWYGQELQGRRTASGETFDAAALSAAHPTLPIPSLVQVTNLENGREVIVRVYDRGPFTGDRLIDLSRGAASVLGFEQAGHARVNVRYLGPAPRRVNMDGSTAPESVHAPASRPAPQQTEEGPRALLQQPAQVADLAGAPPPERAVYAAASAPGTYFVQVGAYSDPNNAQRVRDAVSAAGPVVVDTRTSASGAELFRVRVGPWSSREEADNARRVLGTLGYAESVVAAR